MLYVRTEVYVLHLHFYAKLNLSGCFTMEGPSAGRTTIGIGFLHMNVGNCTIIKTLKNGVELNKLDILSKNISDIIEEATVPVTVRYGVKR
jgi:hypothetical protein